jgi:hypothetical protein
LFLGGPWLAFTGWFLVNAAGSAYAQVETKENLRGVKVKVMAREKSLGSKGS